MTARTFNHLSDPGASVFIARRRTAGGLDGLYDSFTKSVVTTIAAGEDRVINWDGTGTNAKDLYDPQGWLNDAPEADSGYWGSGDWPVGTLLTIPAGFYIWQSLAQVLTTVTSGGWYCYLDVADDPDESDSPMMQANPTFRNGMTIERDLTGSTLAFNMGSFVCDEPTRVVPTFFSPDMDPAKGLWAVEFNLARLASL